MDSTPPFTITPVLREAAELKIKELNRVKDSFKRRYHLNSGLLADKNTINRVSRLLESIKKSDPYLENDEDLTIMTRYIEQAQDDKSISEAKLERFEEQLWDKLNRHLNRMEVSCLHVDLMKEVMEAESSTESAAAKLKKAALEDDFEMVENELEELLERFEKDTFTSKDVDANTIESYLSGLFIGDHSNRGLQVLRNGMRIYGEELMQGGADVDQDILMWAIMDLLKNDLISTQKKKILEGYLQSPIALRELTATLNMKSFRHWDYSNEYEGLPVTARQNAEGQYCITVEEEIIDMLFLHGTAIGWATKLKEYLTEFTRNSMAFAGRDLNLDELNKREFYLMSTRKPIKPKASACTVCHPCFPQVPMPPPPPGIPFTYKPPVVIDACAKKSKKKRSFDMPPLPVPIPLGDSLLYERSRIYLKDFFMSRLPVQEGCVPKFTRTEDVQANLIKTLAVEAKLGKAFHGKVHAITTSFDSLASSLPHKTILTVLKFLGVPDLFLEFFTRFLQAKLNIGPALHGTPDRVLQRSCGVSVGHSLEMFFSEAVLFFLELAVYQKTGSYLYRLHDTSYFVGSQDQQYRCAEQITKFAAIMGMPLKKMDICGGRLAIGCLAMDTLPTTPSSTPSFKIDSSMVEAYAHHIKKQLATCTSVLEWIRIWNSSAGTYGAHLFGPLADVLGKSHLGSVKDAYTRIFAIIFNGSDLTAHITSLLKSRRSKFCLRDQKLSLEALIYLPQAYGGLGVKNPFITINLAHNIHENPDELIENYLKEEEAYYDAAAENYAKLSAEQRQEKLESIFSNNKDRIDSALGPERDLTAFMSREEMTANREYTPYPIIRALHRPVPRLRISTPFLVDVCQDLRREPVENIEVNFQICRDISRLSSEGDMKRLGKLSGEERWVLGMYGAECFEKYGTMEIWWGEGVPREVYKAVRGHVWSDGDDDSSYGTFSEV